MSSFLANKRFVFVYGLIALWGAVVFLWSRFLPPSAFSILLTLYFLIFAPGYFLSRIFHINFESETLGRIVINIALGLAFNFVLFFVAMLLGLNIQTLIIVEIILITIAGLISLIRDWFRREAITSSKCNWRDLFKAQNLVYLLILAIIILILSVISQIGGHMKGDPIYHLGLIRKVVDGSALTQANLAYVKGTVDELYAYPIWHIFMGVLTKITGANIFTLWEESVVALSIIAVLIWAWVFRQIFSTRALALLSFLLFLAIAYTINNRAYIFSRLPVPDTFNQWILLPLSLGLALKFIFDETKNILTKTNYQILIILAILAAAMGIIHAIQFVYYLLILIAFLIIFALSQFRTADYKKILARITLTIISPLILVAPFVLMLQAKSQVITQSLDVFNADKAQVYKYGTFDKFTEYGKFGYVLFVLLPLFFKKYQKFIFIFALFLMVPVIYGIGPIQDFIFQKLSFTTVQRLYSQTSWTFAVFAILIGFILVLIDRLISRLGKWRWVVDAILAVVAIGFIIFQKSIAIFSAARLMQKAQWLDQHYLTTAIIFSLITIIILMIAYFKPKIGEFFTFKEYNHPITLFLLTFIIIFFIGAPYLGQMLAKFKVEARDHQFFREVRDPTADLINFSELGGPGTVDFIKNNLPAKSVINTNNGYFNLPMLVDQTLPSYWSRADKEFGLLYKNVDINQKLECLAWGKIDYLEIIGLKLAQAQKFNQYPQYFTQVFQNQNGIIYKVDLARIKSEGYPKGTDYNKQKTCWAK